MSVVSDIISQIVGFPLNEKSRSGGDGTPNGLDPQSRVVLNGTELSGRVESTSEEVGFIISYQLSYWPTKHALAVVRLTWSHVVNLSLSARGAIDNKQTQN